MYFFNAMFVFVLLLYPYVVNVVFVCVCVRVRVWCVGFFYHPNAGGDGVSIVKQVKRNALSI